MGKRARWLTTLVAGLLPSVLVSSIRAQQQPDAPVQFKPFIIVDQNPVDAKPQAAAAPGLTMKEADPKAAETEKTPKPPVPWWEKVPIIAPLPRPGDFVILPTGPGYYSLFDCNHNECLENPPKYPYPRVSPIFPGFFDFSFAYLDKPDNNEFDYFDPIKRVHCGNDLIFSTGGEYRFRYSHEVDSRLSGVDNVYELGRTRIYGDLWYRDHLRGYVEVLDARSWNQDLPPAATDEDHIDFLNFFVDIKVCEMCDGPLYARLGRQELLYGSQRLISTLDWVNTRRTFQGGKLFWRNEKWSADLFCVNPVIPRAEQADGPDHAQTFSGLWLTYRPKAGHFLDAYYLDLDQAAPVALGRDFVPGSFNVSTLGGRYVGDTHNWLYDVEGAVQFGRWSNQGILAKMGTVGAGYYFKDCCWTPQIWLYYDYASGDPEPGASNVHRTFEQLFPFGHYYFGFIDVVGRKNINDFNAQLTFFPAKWLTVLMQYHVFRLDSPKDALYAASGRAIRIDPTGQAGSDVGKELDLTVNFHLSKHQDVFISYSHLYAGEFIKRTGSPRSPDYLYLQYSFRW